MPGILNGTIASVLLVSARLTPSPPSFPAMLQQLPSLSLPPSLLLALSPCCLASYQKASTNHRSRFIHRTHRRATVLCSWCAISLLPSSCVALCSSSVEGGGGREAGREGL